MPRAATVLYRRSPHVVSYWRDGDLIIENYAVGSRAIALPLTCEILHFFTTWRSANDLCRDKPQVDAGVLQRFVDVLATHSLLQRSDTEVAPSERAMDAWARWNPAAGLFHSSTRDVPFVDLATMRRALRRKSRTNPMPPPVKHVPPAGIIPLEPAILCGEFPGVLMNRRTWRRFSNRPVDRGAFSTLLALTAGVQNWLDVPGEGRVALKTSPSGGARHAIELYVACLRVAGVPRGLYHYAADKHALALVRNGSTAHDVERYLPTQWWYAPTGAIVFFSAVFSRELWRYDYARAYCALFIEAGHLCQTFCLTATWLGLAPFCSMALADSAIEADLRLDGITESVLYAAGVGTRPAHAKWVPPKRIAGEPTTLTRLAIRKFPGRLPRTKR
jgi:SagB-type dehydrogenase family enzyme